MRVLRIIALLSLLSHPLLGQQSLFEETIAQDIATASFYELVAWLDSLGESTQGDRETLVSRIAGIYGVTDAELAAVSPGDPGGAESAGDTISVESASRTRYYSLDAIEEQYVRLSGDVVVTLADPDGARHSIRADEIVLNRAQNTMSASGSVIYLLERDGSVERFSGEALTVQLDDFSGAFVRGVTERERTIDGQEIDFDFSGVYITRSEDDVIVLDEGVITSSQASPPNYYVAADRIWVLSPGEWGLTNAVLHVGRVPVFYLPFFFRPGDELFFNPAVGSRTREGLFIQTTTYLVGTPPEADTPFSILQLADAPVDQSARVREGLFLVLPEDPDPSADPQNSDTVRILLDLYTMLGAFAGFEASLAQLGPLSQFEFFGGVGVSRHIYTYGSGGIAFTPYYITAEGSRQSWNSTTIGEIDLPVRIGTELSFSTQIAGLAASLQFESFSDSRFAVDFLDRQEQINWLGLLGQSEPTQAPGPRTSLMWQVDGRYTPPFSLPQIVRTLSMQRLLLSLRWAERTIESSSLAEEVLAADQSPQTAFFYPDTMRLPEFSARIGGTLFDFPWGSVDQTTVEEEREELTPPWGPEQEDAEPPAETPDGSLSAPPIQPNLPLSAEAEGLTASVTYSVSPTLLLDHEFNDSQWLLPEDIDFSIAYRGLSSRVGSSLPYRLRVASSLVTLDGSFSANGQYRSVFDRDPDLPNATWESLESQAWAFSSFSATNQNTVSLRPLLNVSLLSQSTLSHTVQTVLYRTLFDEVIDGAPRYTSEFIDVDDTGFFRAHRLDATAVIGVLDTQRLQLSADLPPLDPRYAGTMTLRALPFTLRLSVATRRVQQSWVYDPLAVAASFDASPTFSISSDLAFDIDASRFDFLRASASASGFSLLYEARSVSGFTFGGAGTGWESDGDEALRSTRLDASYTLDRQIGPVWRNRVVGDLQTRIGLNADLLRFTQSSFSLQFSTTVLVHRFMAIDFSVSSANDQVYVYVPGLAREVGREPRNVIVDLARSLNFFSDVDRRSSAFNLQRLDLSGVHDLGDWDLTVSLSVEPLLVPQSSGDSEYELDSRFELSVQWRPIGELSTTIGADRDGIQIGDDS